MWEEAIQKWCECLETSFGIIIWWLPVVVSKSDSIILTVAYKVLKKTI